MPEFHGSVRQMPCPDCGNPVVPDRDQLCPNCGYPLMFLRKGSADDDAQAESIPRSPNVRDDATGLRVVPQAGPTPGPDTRRFAAGTYGAAPAGQVRCPSCGYSNEPARIRCERCGHELRSARPQATTLGPHLYARQSARRVGWTWLIVLLILAVIALVVLGLTILWLSLR